MTYAWMCPKCKYLCEKQVGYVKDRDKPCTCPKCLINMKRIPTAPTKITVPPWH